MKLSEALEKIENYLDSDVVSLCEILFFSTYPLIRAKWRFNSKFEKMFNVCGAGGEIWLDSPSKEGVTLEESVAYICNQSKKCYDVRLEMVNGRRKELLQSLNSIDIKSLLSDSKKEDSGVIENQSWLDSNLQVPFKNSANPFFKP